MFVARTVILGTLLVLALALFAPKVSAAAYAAPDSQAVATTREQAPAERPLCRAVKVVYTGHGEADRAPCRPLR